MVAQLMILDLILMYREKWSFLGYESIDILHVSVFAGISQSQSSSHLWQGTELMVCYRLQQKNREQHLRVETEAAFEAIPWYYQLSSPQNK